MVGSAEPLGPEETRQRLRELEAWSVDLSLIEASLRRTPTERIQRMVGLLRVVEEMNRAALDDWANQVGGHPTLCQHCNP